MKSITSTVLNGILSQTVFFFIFLVGHGTKETPNNTDEVEMQRVVTLTPQGPNHQIEWGATTREPDPALALGVLLIVGQVGEPI